MNFFYRLFRWLIAARPATWVASIAPVLLTATWVDWLGGKMVGMTEMIGEIEADLAWYIGLELIACLSMQIACNFTNDYYDFVRGVDDEDRRGPRRILQERQATLPQMKWVIVCFFSISIALGIYFSYQLFLSMPPVYGVGFLFFVIIASFVGYAYTGGSYPLGYCGWGDLAAFVFFGPGLLVVLVFIVLGINLGEEMEKISYLFKNQLSGKNFWFLTVLLGLIPGFFSLAMINLNNLRDIDIDAKKGKRTLAVILGEFPTRILLSIYLGLAVLSPLIFLYFLGVHLRINHLLFLLLFCLLMIRVWRTVIYNRKDQMNQSLKRVGMVYTLESLFLTSVLIVN